MKFIRKILIFVLCLFLTGALLAGYAFKIEPAMLFTHYYDLNAPDRKITQVIRVIQLSDIQVNAYYTEHKLDKLVDKVNDLSPDVIVFTGDLFDNFSKYKAVDAVTLALSSLNASYGKYAVWGNRDYGGGASRVYADIMSDSGFTLLKNEGVTITTTNGQELFIGGLDDALLGTPDISATLGQMGNDPDYRIILLHEPDLADRLETDSADLLLAGHSHGGQVRLPFIKSPSTALAEKYTAGFYDLSKNMKLYVNTGIGTSHIPVRFMVPPEIAVFNIGI